MECKKSLQVGAQCDVEQSITIAAQPLVLNVLAAGLFQREQTLDLFALTYWTADFPQREHTLLLPCAGEVDEDRGPTRRTSQPPVCRQLEWLIPQLLVHVTGHQLLVPMGFWPVGCHE